MKVASTRDELAAARGALPGRVAVVMTMGALHAGHVRLLQVAREQADSVVLTVFVNPLQFGQGEDLDRYPRTLDADLAVAAREGVDPAAVPADAVTSSGSSIDPQISPAYAAMQVPRVARVTGLPEDRVRDLVALHTEGRQWGFLGEERVDVPALNVALGLTAPSCPTP